MRAARTGTGLRVAAAFVALLAVLVATSALALATTPPDAGADTGRLVGRTGSAYLYGLRAYAAAVLWNRIEPLYHDYYSDKPLEQQVELLPSAWLVEKLDPSFEQPYYVAAWVVAKGGDVEQGLEIARRGVESNPRSGLLRASYAQMLLIIAGDPVAARAQSDAALESPDTYWHSNADRFESLAIFASVYGATGSPETAALLRAELSRMREALPEVELGGDHDHDGDGVQDH